MNELEIGIIATACVGWMGWVSFTIIQNSKQISTLNSNTANHSKDVTELKEAFKDSAKNVEKSNTDLGRRLDLFLKTEIQELKSIVGNKE